VKIVNLDEVVATPVQMAGAQTVCKQVPISAADGSPAYTFRVFTIGPNGHTPYHTHPAEHLNYVISGCGVVVDCDGARRKVTPGDFVLVLPNEQHQYRNESPDTPLVLICAVPNQYD